MLLETPIRFESCECIEYAGLLLMLPFLVEAGLLSYQSYYSELKKGYYYLDFIILLLSFMYLARIKNPEQLKKISPGEFGNLLGIDRIPEQKCFRGKLRQIVDQCKSSEWNSELVEYWTSDESNEFYYIDGHVKVYTGNIATLGKKHVARQKLCLPGIQEFWVNNNDSMPYFYVTGEVNEKLLEMMTDHLIPKLLEDVNPRYSEKELAEDTDLPVLTVVFDREGYSPVFFDRLWKEHRIAVLTYRKNVKDRWDEEEFKDYEIVSNGTKEKVKLWEKEVKLNNVKMREIRKLSGNGHQTSIITTNKKLSIESVAENMFARWAQENYFKYMRKEYDFDKLLQYTVEEIDKEIKVTNPEYSNLSYRIKKLREKKSRREAILFNLIEEYNRDDLENTPSQMKKQAKVREEIEEYNNQINDLKHERSRHPSKIKIKDMPESIRYNRLHKESKHFQNIIKMICYRAESSCANVLSGHYTRHRQDRRELVKSIIASSGNMIVDEEKKTILVQIYSLSSPRMNYALSSLCDTLNDSEYLYPNTDFKLFYEIAK